MAGRTEEDPGCTAVCGYFGDRCTVLEESWSDSAWYRRDAGLLTAFYSVKDPFQSFVK